MSGPLASAIAALVDELRADRRDRQAAAREQVAAVRSLTDALDQLRASIQELEETMATRS